MSGERDGEGRGSGEGNYLSKSPLLGQCHTLHKTITFQPSHIICKRSNEREGGREGEGLQEMIEEEEREMELGEREGRKSEGKRGRMVGEERESGRQRRLARKRPREKQRREDQRRDETE